MSARQNFLIFISNGCLKLQTKAERERERGGGGGSRLRQAEAEAQDMAAVVLKSSAYVIELLTELAFGQATCLLTAIVSLHLLSLPAASAGVCLSAKLRKDSAKGHAAEGGRGRGSGRSSTAAAAVAKGVGARTLFYALHALRRKVLIGSTQHTAHCPVLLLLLLLLLQRVGNRDCCLSSSCHKTAASDVLRNMLTATTAACTCHSYLSLSLSPLSLPPSHSLGHPSNAAILNQRKIIAF